MGFGGGGGGGGGAPTSSQYLLGAADGSLPNGIVVNPPDRIGIGLDPLAWFNATTDGDIVTANNAFLTQMFVPMQVTIDRLLCEVVTPGAPTDQADLGIYDRTGTRKVSVGAFTGLNTAGVKVKTVAATPLAPGWYWLALSCNVVGPTFKEAFSSFGPTASGWAIVKRFATSHPLPATLTITSGVNDNRDYLIQGIRQGVTL